MKRPPRTAVWLLGGVIAFGAAGPGCQQVLAALYQLVIFVGNEVARTAVGMYIEKKLDEWIFHKSDKGNSGNGDVRISGSDSNRGYYDGQMEIVVRDEATGKTDTVKVTNPAMVRSGSGSDWKLAPEVIKDAKDVLRRKKGLP
jgi:hypothetical protein